MTRTIAAMVTGVLVVVAAACSGHNGNDNDRGDRTTGGGRRSTTTSRPASTVPATTAAPVVAWSSLRNPILRETDHAVKDPAIVSVDDEWVALFSRVDAQDHWRVGITRSRDLASWSAPVEMPHDPATEGEASPDVVRDPADGTFVVTYQSFVHDRGGALAKLYARTTRDFRSFSAPIRLLANVHAAATDRLIDPALVFAPAGLLLGYKVGVTDGPTPQAFELARSASGTLAGPWVVVGRPAITVFGDTIENYQFLHVDGTYHLLATSNTLDRPELFTLAGNPSTAAGWLHWSAARELQVPQEAWNAGRGVSGATFEHANCAAIVDAGRQADGYYYLVYADAPELTTFGGAGHDVLALARSRDLLTWSVPPS